MTSVIDFRALLREERETARRQASIVAGAHERSGSQSEQGAQSIQRVKELQESAYDKLVETVDKHTDSVDKLRVNPRLVNSAVGLSEAFALPNNVLGDIMYVPDFLTGDAAKTLHDNVNMMGNAASRSQLWTQLKTRRLQCWGGAVGVDDRESTSPAYLRKLGELLVNLGIFDADERPNHYLINQYLPDEGILPHQDGPKYLPKVAIISLNEQCVFTFYKYIPSSSTESRAGQPPLCSLLLRPNSLLVFSGDAYTECLHGIAPDSVHRIDSESTGVVVNKETTGAISGDQVSRSENRTSLTIRFVQWARA
jgi:alkylated DNA repair protein alkB homolog 6